MNKMKRVLSVLAASVLTVSATYAQTTYIDASRLAVTGRPFPVREPFTRIDTASFRLPDNTTSRYACFSTGLAVLFTTDSRNISAKWKTSGSNALDNMNAIVQKGLDLYIRKDGKWTFAGVGRPSMKKPP